MAVGIVEPNTCVRGCCRSESIPLHLSPSSYTLISPIAKGAESVVYEAILDGRRVAAKKPVLSTSDDLDKFHKHLQLLCKLDHPGVARLVAAHAKPPNYMFFFEFYESGTLAEKLHIQEWTPSIDQALMITFQLAKALQYLHKNGIVHRDVKPANVLLDKDASPYLADFGLADYQENLKGVTADNWRSSGKPTGGFHKKNMVGTIIYMAPEILRKQIHSEKSDVYSFGISINELLTGVVPYTDLRAEAQAHTVLEMNYTEQQLTTAVVSSGLRPALSAHGTHVPEILPSLIQRCWDTEPQNRPSFDDIVFELEPILKNQKMLKEEDVDLNKSSVSHNDSRMEVVENNRTYMEINWFSRGESFSKNTFETATTDAKIWLGVVNDSTQHLPVLSWGSFSTCGRRESMEDTHFLMPHMGNEENIHLFGVFDGHRGAAAAEFSARAFPGLLQALSSRSSPVDALLQAFVETDLAFRDELNMCRQCKRVMPKDCHPGCTAIASLIVRDKLFVANAGDCRAILCRAGRPIALSKDHVASCVEERERVVREGGCVEWLVDTWRVAPAGLQVTRSIGDDDLKPAVTAEPEITETILSSDDKFLVMASDGLWDVVSMEEVISIIGNTVKEPGMCSKRLATEAAERGSKDNITVIVVFLQPVSTAERVYLSPP